MYSQNLGARSDALGEPIFTKCCTRVRVPDVFLSFEFQKDRVKNVAAVGVEISPLPLKGHIDYTTACCYRFILYFVFVCPMQCTALDRI